jgi:hypothetical protein
MKWFFLGLLSISAFAKPIGPQVDKIKKMVWDGENYTITFTNYEKKIVISDKNQTVPCLENAVKSDMEVLIEIDSDIPIITTCKLYSSSAPVRFTPKQAPEKLSK